MTVMTVKIRTPYEHEADACARLIYASGPRLFSYLYAEDGPGLRRLFSAFFALPGNTFSRETIDIEEENGSIRGLVNAHPVRDLRKFLFRELGVIRNSKGTLPGFLKTLAALSAMALHYPRLAGNELFVCNLAVFSEYRRMGVASRLLKRTEEKASQKGLTKLSLYVEIDNENAITLYKKYGFSEAGKAVLPKKYNSYGLYGFIKMLKNVERSREQT